MAAQSCRVCGNPIIRRLRRGRIADYCSIRCRRRLEKRRLRWDKHVAMCGEGGYYAVNRDMPDRTPEQRAYWQQQLDEARAALGVRP
jgi:hypothetical protein